MNTPAASEVPGKRPGGCQQSRGWAALTHPALGARGCSVTRECRNACAGNALGPRLQRFMYALNS